MNPNKALEQDPEEFWRLFGEYLGFMPDYEAAEFLRLPLKTITEHRNKIGIPCYPYSNIKNRKEILGKYLNHQIEGEICRIVIEPDTRWTGSPEVSYRIIPAECSSRLGILQEKEDDDWVPISNQKAAHALIFDTPLGVWLKKEAPVKVDVEEFASFKPKESAMLHLR